MKGTSQGPVNFKFQVCHNGLPVATLLRLATLRPSNTIPVCFPDTRNLIDIFPPHDITKKPVAHLLIIEC